MLLLIVVALPLQGLMAATMPLCGYKVVAAHDGGQSAHNHADHTGQHDHSLPHESPKHADQPGTQCYDCASCQVCASPALVGMVQTLQAPVEATPLSPPAAATSPYFPELFQRPPLAL